MNFACCYKGNAVGCAYVTTCQISWSSRINDTETGQKVHTQNLVKSIRLMVPVHYVEGSSE